MKTTIISDTHNDYIFLNLKPEDCLIHCGDIDIRNQVSLHEFNNWLGKQPFKYKIVCAGNHDKYLESCGKESIQRQLTNAIYLENSGTEIEGVKFWGSPITPTFLNWHFMCDRDKISKYWELIPSDTDVLITHGPCYNILDYLPYKYGQDHHVGCEELLNKVKTICPKIHAFGHIHYSYGMQKIEKTTFINAKGA